MTRTASQGPAWAGSNRSDRLPPNWRALRRFVLKRDEWRCTAIDDGVRCKQGATDVDHVDPGDDHSLGNLTSLCLFHHRAKTAAEGNAARRRPTAQQIGRAHV